MPIHDQSYRRYKGGRAALGRSWLVIARAGIATMMRKRPFLGLMFVAWFQFIGRVAQIYFTTNFPQAALFAPTGSLLEPFTETQTGDPYRHDGRDAVRTWFAESFAGTPWRAMRVTSTAAGEQPNTTIAEWEYMDPRLAQPLRGRTRYTIAAGEIFEAQIELLDAPVLAPAPAGSGSEGGATTTEGTAPGPS